jgi:hypothetical protein
MAYADLSEIRTALKEWVNRADISDAQYDEFINFAMRRMKRGLSVADIEATTTLTIDANQEATVPSDYREALYITASANSRTYTLERESANTIRNTQHIPGDRPKTFAKVAGKFIFAPLPTQGDTLEMFYYAKPVDLVNDSDTNVFVTELGDVLLFGAQAAASAFTKNDTDQVRFEGLFGNGLAELIQEEMKEEWSGETPAVNLA